MMRHRGSSLQVSGGTAGTLRVSVHAVLDPTVLEREFSLVLEELESGSVSFHLDGFVSPVIHCEKAVTLEQCTAEIHEQLILSPGDHLYARVFQTNRDVAYTSPVSFR